MVIAIATPLQKIQQVLTGNRVSLAIEKTQNAIAERLAAGTVSQEQVDALHKHLDMGFEEYCKFQELKSLATASGQLTLEEGNLIYSYLGNSTEHFNSQSLAVKSTLTKMYAELLEMSIKSLKNKR
jgi:hypothetical protein